MKNYSLVDAAEQIKYQCGDKPIIVSMANGRINQEISPKYFSKVIYCVVLHNAWRDIEYIEKENKLIVGSQKRGPLLIGTCIISHFKSSFFLLNLIIMTIVPTNKTKDQPGVDLGVGDISVGV